MDEKSKPTEGRQKRQELFINLYISAFPSFARYVSRRGGSLDEAKDIFQDALIIWFEKSELSDIKINGPAKAYILGIAKHLWIKQFNCTIHNTGLDQHLNLDIITEENNQISDLKILRYLETAGKKCMDLLTGFYYDKLSPAKLAQKFGFSGERSATVQKYKCLEKVRNEVKQKSLSYADFID